MLTAPNPTRRRPAGGRRVQYATAAAALAVMAVTPHGAAAESVAALADRVRGDCIAAGETPHSCDCMVDGLSERLSDADARRFFLLTLDEPATGLPMLSLDEVDAFTARLEAAMGVVGPACHP